MNLVFDYDYAKMPKDTSKTRLLEVIKMHYNLLHPPFVVYDTEYENGYYQLPDDDLLLLIFASLEENEYGGYTERIWTTLRRYSKEKETRYVSEIGKSVKIVTR